jgi:CHASE3 domain sensor protein
VNLAEQISVQTSDARRAERSYLLLRDPQYLKTNQEALVQVHQIAREIRSRASSEPGLTATVLENIRRDIVRRSSGAVDAVRFSF